jgi:hypothetical protein
MTNSHDHSGPAGFTHSDIPSPSLPTLRLKLFEEFRSLNEHFYLPETAEEHSQRDFDLLAERVRKLNKREGPRVGDFVIMPDETIRRFTHDWTDSLQTTIRQNAQGNVHLNQGGFCEFAGSLDSSLPIECIEETTETRLGRVWFFSNNIAKMHHAVHGLVSFRVYQYRPATQPRN